MSVIALLLTSMPYLGLTTEFRPRDAGVGTCAEVFEVVDGGPASVSGLQKGDCIRSVSVANKRFPSFCEAGLQSSVGAVALLEMEDGGVAPVRWGECSEVDYPVMVVEVRDGVSSSRVSSFTKAGLIWAKAADSCKAEAVGPCGRSVPIPRANVPLNSECITVVTITCPSPRKPTGTLALLRFPSGFVQGMLLSDGQEPPKELKCRRIYTGSPREYSCAAARDR